MAAGLAPSLSSQPTRYSPGWLTTARVPFLFTYNDETRHVAGSEGFMHDVLVLGLVKLGVVAVISFIAGIIEAAKKPLNGGWTPVVQEPLHKRAWNLLRRRGSTSIEVREDRVRVHKKP